MQRDRTRKPVPGKPGLYTRDGAFFIRVRDDGKYRWVRCRDGGVDCRSKDEAWKWRHRFLGLDEAERVLPSSIRFGEYATRWVAERNVKPSTRALYATLIRKQLAPLHERRLVDITPQDVRQLVSRLRNEGLAENTLRNVVAVTSGIFRTAVADRVVGINPVQLLERNHRPSPQKRPARRLLKPGEKQALLDACPDWLRPIATTLLLTGLRLGEVLALQWGDVDGDVLHVRRQLDVGSTGFSSTKSGEERTVEIAPTLAAVLRAHRGDRIRRAGDLIFPSAADTPIHRRNLQRAFETAVERAGLAGEPKLTPHMLRHTYASALIAAGADPVYVAAQLGHADATVTLQVYAREFSEARTKGTAASAIERVFGSGEIVALG